MITSGKKAWVEGRLFVLIDVVTSADWVGPWLGGGGEGVLLRGLYLQQNTSEQKDWKQINLRVSMFSPAKSFHIKQSV
jgi:hypothetical protein